MPNLRRRADVGIRLCSAVALHLVTLIQAIAASAGLLVVVAAVAVVFTAVFVVTLLTAVATMTAL